MVDEIGIFEERRQADPQGVITDLVKQTTKQGKEINRLLKVVEQQTEQLKAYEAKFGSLTPEKKSRTKENS